MEPWLELFATTNFRRSADTAHDLKTPLNVAVLNLELLKMRIGKLTDGGDQKLTLYAAAIEAELRRMARIFDAFFLLSTPPKEEGEPVPVDLCPLCAEAAAASGYDLGDLGPPVRVRGHDSRFRQVFKMFFEGASRVLEPGSRHASAARDGDRFDLAILGTPLDSDFELTKIFKFYYTDPLGNPDLSLAVARLIAETYGGELNAWQEHDKVSMRLSFPLVKNEKSPDR